MGKLIDSEAVIEMLRHESREWNEKSGHTKDSTYKSYLAGIASGYGAAASDIAGIVRRQAEGSVPADKLSDSVTSEI